MGTMARPLYMGTPEMTKSSVGCPMVNTSYTEGKAAVIANAAARMEFTGIQRIWDFDFDIHAVPYDVVVVLLYGMSLDLGWDY
ncbi:hypothetical protein L1887_22717 [Cichorium endivia]|nr:hypothetical protein L1887_22717 [Cichorium endivia]